MLLTIYVLNTDIDCHLHIDKVCRRRLVSWRKDALINLWWLLVYGRYLNLVCQACKTLSKKSIKLHQKSTIFFLRVKLDILYERGVELKFKLNALRKFKIVSFYTQLCEWWYKKAIIFSSLSCTVEVRM